ncbi:predicted protein [Uncinocarpus reesii 1704]|uniref:Copper transporter n=1 Tax=Uncinocarpus reesii (strain UAMH 1704) TaxID=336963 RepID=C4JDZ1_UNCRE|nr:uncharacterized protein UREG_00415 [Uncinocarpus reesii 1704]EEP75569.1 predicted protein [Uncinocarpus reesii 1704]
MMKLVRLYCSLILLLPTLLAAPLPQKAASPLATRWNQHEDEAPAHVSRSRSTLLAGSQLENRNVVSKTPTVLTRAAKSRPGDRWPYMFSTLTPDMVKGSDWAPETRFVDKNSISKGEIQPGKSEPRDSRMRIVTSRYMTLFSRLNGQSTPHQPCSPSENCATFPEDSEDYFDSDEQSAYDSMLVWISGHPIRMWGVILAFMLGLFILSVVMVETLTALSDFVLSRWKGRRASGIRLEGGEKKITAL